MRWSSAGAEAALWIGADGALTAPARGAGRRSAAQHPRLAYRSGALSRAGRQRPADRRRRSPRPGPAHRAVRDDIRSADLGHHRPADQPEVRHRTAAHLHPAGGPPHSSGLWCYPEAADVAKLPVEDLTTRKFSRSKAETLVRLAQLVETDRTSLNAPTTSRPPVPRCWL